MPVSNLRVDDTLVHGHIRTRDTKVVQMRPENLEANPPLVLLLYYAGWMLVRMLLYCDVSHTDSFTLCAAAHFCCSLVLGTHCFF